MRLQWAPVEPYSTRKWLGSFILWSLVLYQSSLDSLWVFSKPVWQLQWEGHMCISYRTILWVSTENYVPVCSMGQTPWHCWIPATITVDHQFNLQTSSFLSVLSAAPSASIPTPGFSAGLARESYATVSSCTCSSNLQKFTWPPTHQSISLSICQSVGLVVHSSVSLFISQSFSLSLVSPNAYTHTL